MDVFLKLNSKYVCNVWFTGVDYLPLAVFDTITLKNGEKSAKFIESAEIIALIWLKYSV